MNQGFQQGEFLDLASPVIDLDNVNTIAIFPNPASTSIFITKHEFKQGDNIAVIDLDGKVILEKRINQPTSNLNVSNLLPGYYLLRFSSQISEPFILPFIKI